MFFRKTAYTRANQATRNYVGLSTSYHDGAFAIVDSRGEVVFAEATERSLQSKRSLCIPPDLVQRAGDLIETHCERGTEIVVAHSWSSPSVSSARDLARFLGRKRLAIKPSALLPEIARRDLASSEHGAVSHWLMTAFSGQNLNYELSRIGWGNMEPPAVRRYDHHLTHAITACHSSGFDDALCAIVDGLGEGTACAFYRYHKGKLTRIPPAREGGGSLGLFYLAVCIVCGFGELTGEEWKVMGLAAYGRRDEELVGLFRKAIRVDGLTLRQDTSAEMKNAFARLERKKVEPPAAAADIAHAGQLVFTETLMQLLRNLFDEGGSTNLVFSGGCALNSSASGAILANTPFRSLHVFSAPGDDGNAIGAARLAWLEDHPEAAPPKKFQSPYLGSTVSQEVKSNVMKFSGARRRMCGADAPKIAAELLAAGKIIGWMQGRAEFGPRALGNRSILADPRSPTIKETINARVKFREEYRPFAPSILHEFGPAYFEDYQESPYMERTLRFRPEVANRVPGVVHIDGTGRLQSVKAEWNPLFHALITEFHRLTQVPLVVNTSFNVMGKPIVHSVEDAIAVFYSTGLDAVFIEDLLLEK